jgi:hypothetical protein
LKRWKKELIIFAVCGLLLLLYVWNLRRTSPNLDEVKLREVQELSRKLPAFPRFTEVGSNTKSGYTGVDLTKHYYSKAGFADVKAFYRQALERDGWTVVREDSGDNESSEITFQKGQFSISIFHTKSSSVYNYAIDFVWNNQR